MTSQYLKQTEELTADNIVDVQVPQEVQISPSGRHVIYQCKPSWRKDKHEVSSIWIAELGKEFSARQLTSGLFNDQNPSWSPDGESVAFISDRAKKGESSAIYILPLQGAEGEAFAITPSENKRPISLFRWSPNGHFIAFASADEKTAEKEAQEKDGNDAKVYGQDWEFNRLRCVHVATRDTFTLFSEDRNVSEFTWKEDSTEIIYIMHATPDLNAPFYHGSKFQKISLSSRTNTSLCENPGMAREPLWCKNDVYFLANFVPNSFCSESAVWKLSLDDKTCSRYAYGTENKASALRSTGGNSVAVHVQAGLSDQLHLLDGSLLYNELNLLSTWDMKLVDKVPVIVIGKGSFDSPVELYSLTGKEGSKERCQLSQHGASVAKLLKGKAFAKPFYCKAKDGTDLEAVLITPTPTTSKSSQPLATVVVVHGGPYDRATIGFQEWWTPWLVAAGYVVLLPNYRGGSARGEKFAKAAEGGMGTVEYDDIISVVEAGISEGIVDKDKVAIGGWSQGGFLSYLAVSRTLNNYTKTFAFRAAVCGAGVADWDLMSMTSDAPFFEASLAGGPPWEASDPHSTTARHGSAIWHLGATKSKSKSSEDENEEQRSKKISVLILHGEDDKRVPYGNAVAFHRGCHQNNIPCEMVSYPREPHIFKERNHHADILKRIRRFYDMHLR